MTGATGFIGKYIIDNLLARGFHVRALTRTARAHVNDNLTWAVSYTHLDVYKRQRLELPLGDFIHGFLQADFPTQAQGGARSR